MRADIKRDKGESQAAFAVRCIAYDAWQDCHDFLCPDDPCEKVTHLNPYRNA